MADQESALAYLREELEDDGIEWVMVERAHLALAVAVVEAAQELRRAEAADEPDPSIFTHAINRAEGVLDSALAAVTTKQTCDEERHVLVGDGSDCACGEIGRRMVGVRKAEEEAKKLRVWFCSRCGTIKSPAFCSYHGDAPGCPGCPRDRMELLERAEAEQRSSEITAPSYSKPQHDPAERPSWTPPGTVTES